MADDTPDGPPAGPVTPVSGPADPSASDPFARFAPAAPQPPNRLARAGRAAWRVLRHEWTLAALTSLALAALMTWPTLRRPMTTIPEDAIDPSLQAWQMAWSGHALKTDLGSLWHANGFYPEPYSFAFSDTLLGYAPAGLVGDGSVAAVMRYNIMYVLAHALAFLGAYALIRQLGAGRVGAAIAGLACGFAPWRLSQAGHLHVLSSGGIALALAMLARGHGWSLRHGYRPERRRPGWVLAGWLVAAWQLSLGFGIGLGFAYALALIAVVAAVWWTVSRLRRGAAAMPFGWPLLAANLGGGLVFGAVGVLMALPYYEVAELHPYAKRTTGLLDMYSPPLLGFVTAPEHSLIWGPDHAALRERLAWAPEMALLPGFTLYALALTGLFFSVWTLRQRLFLVAAVLGTGALSMGTQFFGGEYGYLLLFEYLPGWEGVRTPGRLMLWTTLLLTVLAAGAVTEILRRAAALRHDPGTAGLHGWLRLATIVPALLVLAEGLNTTPHPTVPTAPAALRQTAGPAMVLPSDFRIDSYVLLWSTAGFPKVVNGNSGFTPNSLGTTRKIMETFPDQLSVEHLRKIGIRSVVVLRDELPGTPWEQIAERPVDQLGVSRTEVDGALVFTVT
ncbi:hypothetical protein [Pilimelia columellifera]|uniref:4-amino-4-deoxy-L-arabinose transferase n=1 Tax=Pilimelia columellifera subsp. columellifera TaxID=706583 RepID=A0ABN3N4B2_9ACTN